MAVYTLFNKSRMVTGVLALLLCCGVAALTVAAYSFGKTEPAQAPQDAQEKQYIKWVDFTVPYEVMDYAMQLDIKSREEPVQLDWIQLLAYCAAKNGGNFQSFKRSAMDTLVTKLRDGTPMAELIQGLQYYSYYLEAYTAVLGGLLGEYEIQVKDENEPEGKKWIAQYGLRAFSPIAKNYWYTDYDDFGNGRSYGYKRKHLGHDMLGSVGTPIIAVESGTVEALGWNQYGGWRIGIRSLDQKRYYYYAHMRQNFPFPKHLREGSVVKAGDVIGYMGRTGYSTKENTNNIHDYHLHFGMQLIFDESQKEGDHEIWIDVYQITKLLSKKRSEVIKDQQTKEYARVYDIRIP